MAQRNKYLLVLLFITSSSLLLFNHKSVNAFQVSSPGTFEPAECWFENPIPFMETTGFDCGFVIVPELHANPDGPTIKIPVAIKRATGENRKSDPVFFAQGGPGGDAFEVFPILLLGSRIGDDRDIIIFNQRGTLYAEPRLACPETIAAMDEIVTATGDAADIIALDALTACYNRLQAEGVNLSAFNSFENAADVDLIRETLGYDEYNFYGVSYGSLLGLHLIRNHPENLRSVIIDGIVPPQLNFITEVAINTDRVFSEIIETCEGDPECQEKYSNIEQRLFALVEKFNETPVTVTLKDSETSRKVEAILDGDTLVDVLFQAFYFPDSYSIFPKLIKNLEEGDYTFIEYVWSRFAFDRGMSEGMYFSVICSEENEFTPNEIQIAEIRPYFAKNAASDMQTYLDSCAIWQVESLPQRVNAPVQSNIPTLLFSGQYDPITPPRFAEVAAEGLTGGFSFVQPTGSHGVAFDNGCTNDIISQFLNAPDVKPDASCLNDIVHANFIEPDALSFPFIAEIGNFTDDFLIQMGTATLFFLGIMSSFLVLPLIWFVRMLTRKKRLDDRVEPRARRLRWVGAVLAFIFGFFASVFISFALYFIIDSLSNGMANIFAISGSAATVFIIPLILVLLAIAIIVVAILAWKEASWSIWMKLYYSFLAICALGYVVTLSLGGMLTVLL